MAFSDGNNLNSMTQGARDELSVSVVRRQLDETDLVTLKSPPSVAFQVYAVIDERPLERECFVACLKLQKHDADVIGFETFNDWYMSSETSERRQVILYNIGSRSLLDEAVKTEVSDLVIRADTIPFIVIGPSDDIKIMISVLECGASGYIPPCVDIVSIIEATRMIIGGATLLSRESLLRLRGPQIYRDGSADPTVIFTERQYYVAQLLRHGMSNKLLALELGMNESTLKVHIRHIFKLLNATNRTEAAFKLNLMSGWRS